MMEDETMTHTTTATGKRDAEETRTAQTLAVEHGTILRDGRGWVPEVYVEDDSVAVDLLTAEYGPPTPIAYRSEGTGWDVSADGATMAGLRDEG